MSSPNGPDTAGRVAARLRERAPLDQLALKDRALDVAAEGVTIADASLPDRPLIYRSPCSGLWRSAIALALAALPCCATTPAATTPGAYRSMARSADGIGKRYMGREIASVMGWQGAPWLERDERQREERTDLLVAALPLRPGMVVADIGAGTGYLTRRIAPAVMPGGKALAVDVQPQMVQMLETMVRQTGLTQIQPLLGAEDDVRLPTAAVDLAIMVDVYHELAYPFEMLDSITRALKPGGLLVFVEYRAEDEMVPIKPVHKMSEAQIRREAAVHPLVWDRTIATLPWQHVVIFRKRDRSA